MEITENFKCTCSGPENCIYFKEEKGSTISKCRRHESEYSYAKIDDCYDYIVILSCHKSKGFQITRCNYKYEFDGRTAMFSTHYLNTKWWCNKALISKEFHYDLFSESFDEFIDNCISNRYDCSAIAPPIEIFRINKAIEAIRCLIGIRKFKSAILLRIPKDVILIIIRKIWLSRKDEIWESDNHYSKIWTGILFENQDRDKDDSNEDDSISNEDDSISNEDDNDEEDGEDDNNDEDYEIYLLNNYINSHKNFNYY
jgi:hypothetical protein